MRRGRRRSRYSHTDPDELPKREPLKGDIIGARLLGVRFREEGVIAHGAIAERWRLTDDIDALLALNGFVPGSDRRDVRRALETRYPSPVAGVSMVEYCEGGDFKVHTMPYGDSALVTVRRNPNYNPHWGAKYIKTWSKEPIELLARLCQDGTDLLISNEAEEFLRGCDDFYHSDLVIGRRDSWYSVVKYRPTKAAARRKFKTTVTRKEARANELAALARELSAAAADAYIALRGELDKYGVILALAQVQSVRHGGSYYYRQDDNSEALTAVRHIRALLPIHAALAGKHAYRYNPVWQGFLDQVRARPADLGDDAWGNYADVREWLAAECRLRKLPPTKAMLEAEAKAKAADLAARTCARCGDVQEQRCQMNYPPPGCKARYGPADRLCLKCWEAESDVILADAERERHAVEA